MPKSKKQPRSTRKQKPIKTKPFKVNKKEFLKSEKAVVTDHLAGRVPAKNANDDMIQAVKLNNEFLKYTPATFPNPVPPEAKQREIPVKSEFTNLSVIGNEEEVRNVILYTKSQSLESPQSKLDKIKEKITEKAPALVQKIKPTWGGWIKLKLNSIKYFFGV